MGISILSRHWSETGSQTYWARRLGERMKLGFLVIELWIYQVIWMIPEELRAE